MAEDEGPLRRWSRRKAAAGKPAPEAEPGESAEPPAPAPDDAGAGEPEAPAEVAPEDLPDIETLEKDSDFAPFLREGVPEELRRLALRRLWRLDPVLANLDGLIDYGDDYTDAATVIKGMKTVYEVGRGFAGPEDAEAAEAADSADEAAERAAEPAEGTESGEAAEAPAPEEAPPAEDAEGEDQAAPSAPAAAEADAPPEESEPAERRPRTRLSLDRLSGLDEPFKR